MRFRVLDADLAVSGLTVRALDDRSQVLGSASTDSDGTVTVALSKSGELWLVANDGNGRGIVAAAVAQNGGTTDVGERAPTFLDAEIRRHTRDDTAEAVMTRPSTSLARVLRRSSLCVEANTNASQL